MALHLLYCAISRTKKCNTCTVIITMWQRCETLNRMNEIMMFEMKTYKLWTWPEYCPNMSSCNNVQKKEETNKSVLVWMGLCYCAVVLMSLKNKSSFTVPGFRQFSCFGGESKFIKGVKIFSALHSPLPILPYDNYFSIQMKIFHLAPTQKDAPIEPKHTFNTMLRQKKKYDRETAVSLLPLMFRFTNEPGTWLMNVVYYDRPDNSMHTFKPWNKGNITTFSQDPVFTKVTT